MKIPKKFIGNDAEVQLHFETAGNQSPENLIEELAGHTVESDELISASPDCKILFREEPAQETSVHVRPYHFFASTSHTFPSTEPRFPWPGDQAFNELLKYPWGILVLLCPDAAVALINNKPQRMILFFEALLDYYDSFADQTVLFEKNWLSSDRPVLLWHFPSSSLYSLMVRSGVPKGCITRENIHLIKGEEIKFWIKTYILQGI